MYYPNSENKGADQLRGYREADLRLCFCLCILLVFPWGGSFLTPKICGVGSISDITEWELQVNLIKTVSLGSMETVGVISGTML